VPEFWSGIEPLLATFTTSGVKFGHKFEFSVPDFLYGEKIKNFNHNFRILLPVKFLT